jgi:putative transposase
MARQRRLLPAGFPVHVVHRGVNRAACFGRDTDRLCYLHLLREHARASACAVHAYVLMPNHVHLLLTPDDATGVSRLMKNVAQRYTQYVNRTQERTGPLWEGRFKSSVVTDDAYLLACYRYIELNPVRALLVRHPADYAWSSHRANAGVEIDTLVKRHPVYIGLATHDDACAAAYRRLFDDPRERDRCDEIRIALSGGLPLGRREYRVRFAAAWRRQRDTVRQGERAGTPMESGV